MQTKDEQSTAYTAEQSRKEPQIDHFVHGILQKVFYIYFRNKDTQQIKIYFLRSHRTF